MVMTGMMMTMMMIVMVIEEGPGSCRTSSSDEERSCAGDIRHLLYDYEHSTSPAIEQSLCENALAKLSINWNRNDGIYKHVRAGG